MAIQWFPGHMASAQKKAAEAMALTDVVIEVLDARIPGASTNPLVQQLRILRSRPCLKVLNKPDLADPEATRDWLDYYNQQDGVTAVSISCKKLSDVAKIPALCQLLAPHRNDNIKPLRMMIMGIPNVGKSTMMNALVRRKIAKVGDEPAVTRAQQVHIISPRYSITDTPGLMWPKIEYPSDGFMLAASHAIGKNAVDDVAVALFLAGILLERYPGRIAERYGFSVDNLDNVALLENVAKRRAMVVRGGDPDIEKAASALLQDFRHGRLGRISLETPESRAQMILQHQTKPLITGPEFGSESAPES